MWMHGTAYKYCSLHNSKSEEHEVKIGNPERYIHKLHNNTKMELLQKYSK